MPDRQSISKKIRFEILKRDKFTCKYCGAKAPDVLLHIEHIEPVSKGGTNDIENLLAACANCNLGKGARQLTDNSAIEKSRDQLAQSQAEIEQLEEMIKWRKQIIKKKGQLAKSTIDEIESLAGVTLSEYGRKNIAIALEKYDFERCAEFIGRYIPYCDYRDTNDLRHVTFSTYIKFMLTKDTPEARKKYLLGIVRNRSSNSALGEFNNWLHSAELDPDDIEFLITSLKDYDPSRGYLNYEAFDGWWHDCLKAIFGRCCIYHCGMEDSDE